MTTPDPEQRWTESDYRNAGWRKLGVRVSELAHIRLSELAEQADMSRGELIEEMIAERYERRGAKDNA